MAESYYSILTSIGKAQIANALGLGTKVDFVTMKVGDGNGSYYNPTESQTDLVHTVWQGAIGQVAIDEDNSNWINIEVLIPPDVGGFFIREYGVFDASGNMLAIAKCAETYKPLPSDGSTKEINMKMVLAISNTSSITLKIDPTIIFAKKKDVDEVSSRVDALTTQLSDLMYQTAGGTATAITLTMQSLVSGYAKTFIAGASNNGAATTINGKPAYKPNTTTPPNFIAGKAYTVWYNSSKDCFFIKASAEGNTIAAHVLAGDTFSNDSDTGLLGTLDLSKLTSANIKSGVTINGVAGKASVVDTADATASTGQILNGQSSYVNGVKVTGNMPNHSGADSPANSIAGTGQGRIYVRPQYGYYDGSVASYVDDGNFVSANIISGKSIFGVNGSATPMPLYAGDSYILFQNTNSNDLEYATSYTSKGGARINNQGGTVRVSFDMRAPGGFIAYGKIYVNGVPRGTERSTSSTTYVTFTEDITINAGDDIRIYAYQNTSAQVHGYIMNIFIKCGNPYPYAG